MEQGKNRFTIEYEQGHFKEFEKKILVMGECKAFLPTSFVQVGDIDKVTYDCSGYLPIAECKFRNRYEMMSVLEKCTLMLLRCCEYLINPRKMALNVNTIFWSEIKNEVRIAYVPRILPFEQTVLGLIELLEDIKKSMEDRETARYLKLIEEYIAESGGSLFDVVNYIGELKQEIHTCGWNEKSRA